MRKLIRLSYLALVGILAAALSACSSDFDYTGAAVPANQVYFSNTEPSTIQIDKNAGSFNITLHRVDSVGELNVPLTFTPGEGNIYTVPTSVTFADGKKTADIKVTFDPAAAKYGSYTGGTIAISGSDIDNTYGLSSYTFTAGATEWTDFDENKSFGSYREDLMTTFFNVDNVVYNVKMQKSIVNKGMYRMVNTYGKAYPYNEDGDYDASKNYYWVINATDPDHVYFETYNSEMTWSYGQFSFTSLVAYYLSKGQTLDAVKQAHPEYFGTLKDGIITMPASSMLISMAKYNNGGWYQGNANGMLAVALPGYTIADYNVAAAYKGRFTDASDQDYARFTLTLGSDVASVKCALASSGDDLDKVATGITDGSVKSVSATADGDIELPYTDSGDYTLVVVAYNANGDAVGTYTVAQKLKSSKETVEQFTDIASGTFTIGAEDVSTLVSKTAWGLLLQQTTTQEAVLSQSQSDPTHFKLTPFLSEDSKYALTFTVDANGNIVVDGVETGLSTESGMPGMLMASDIVTYFGADTDNGKAMAANGGASTYDRANNLYTFVLYYYVGEGAYGLEKETFKVENSGAKALAKAIAKAKRAAKAKRGAHRNIQAKGHLHLLKHNTASLRLK
jgi:hypothetical protein